MKQESQPHSYNIQRLWCGDQGTPTIFTKPPLLLFESDKWDITILRGKIMIW
jgi:hypothetical protein